MRRDSREDDKEDKEGRWDDDGPKDRIASPITQDKLTQEEVSSAITEVSLAPV